MLPYTIDELDAIIKTEGEDAYWYQQRRHPEWTENYTLYRDRVFINRLVQRQSVNIPLMKYVIQTSLTAVDDPTELYFRSKDNDEQREIYLNEYYQFVRHDQSIDLKDLADKKQVFLTGISTKSWNIENGKMVLELHDSFDIFFSQFTDPTDIDGTCRYMDHRHIFKPLSSLRLNPDYDKAAIGRLELFYAETAGVIAAGENQASLMEKNQRMMNMGAPRVMFPQVGETYVELRKCFIKLYNKELEDEEYFYVVKCENEVLLAKRLEEVIGETEDHYWRYHLPYDSWSEDLERTDIYPDGIGDMIRPLNKVTNAWFSQEVENRTFRNFGMNYFNSSLENFDPQSFEANAWGWYPIPVPVGQKIDDVVSNVQIPNLSDNYNAMSFVIGMAEKASAANPIYSGAYGGSPRMTLGEMQIVLQQAKTRLQALIKYSTPSWERLGTKFCKMVEAAGDKLDAQMLYKKAGDHVYKKEVAPEMWATKSGYLVEVTTVQEQQAEAISTVQGLEAVQQLMPQNNTLRTTIQKKALMVIPGLSANEVKAILDEQELIEKQMAANPQPQIGPDGKPVMASPQQNTPVSYLPPNQSGGAPENVGQKANRLSPPAAPPSLSALMAGGMPH